MRATLVGCLVVAALYSRLALAQSADSSEATNSGVPNGSSADMQRVVKALSGTWSTTETDTPPQRTPHTTSGTEVWYASTGGITLIEENRTKTAEGDAYDTALIWWNGTARKIQGIWCADINDEGCSNFEVSWENSDIIMAGEWVSGGQRNAWKEVFTLSGPNEFTQTLHVGSPGGDLKPVSVIQAKRSSDRATRHAQGKG